MAITKMSKVYHDLDSAQVTYWDAIVILTIYNSSSVPARLGKGQGTKEIGHNLACERQNLGTI